MVGRKPTEIGRLRRSSSLRQTVGGYVLRHPTEFLVRPLLEFYSWPTRLPPGPDLAAIAANVLGDCLRGDAWFRIVSSSDRRASGASDSLARCSMSVPFSNFTSNLLVSHQYWTSPQPTSSSPGLRGDEVRKSTPLSGGRRGMGRRSPGGSISTWERTRGRSTSRPRCTSSTESTAVHSLFRRLRF